MVSGGSGAHSTAIDDLPGLVARVATDDASRTAIAVGDATVTYGDLHRELTALDTAMGGVLGADALVPLALSTLAPGAVETADGGLDAVVEGVVDDARSVLGEQAPTSAVESHDTLPSRFRAQVRRTPDAAAIVFEGTTLTYAEFDAKVNQLARRLVESGVGPDVRVGLSISRSTELLVAMYAIVEAGGAYVPLDPGHPADRISYVLGIAEPALVLTTSTEHTALPDSVTTLNVDTEDVSGYSSEPLTDGERALGAARPANTAYVIFTSGSTGRPKGVAVSHEAIVANLDWRQADYPLTEDDVVLQKTPFTFDVSVWEFFWPLQTGASLVVAAPDGHRDPAYIAEIMAERSVTTAHFVPSMLSVFLGQFDDSGPTDRIPTLRQVFASGEALPASAAKSFHTLFGAELHNLYGPTEAAVDVTYHRTDNADTVSVPIGVAVPRTELHVLDEGLNRTPPGVPGELYLSGVQLARGYLNRPDLTADRFVADVVSGSGERMYRTGDLVRWNTAGVLEYLGRTDFQVKLRGLRIELGEIEAALLAQDAVQQAVVVVLSDETASGVDDRLVAYVVTTTGEADSDALAAGVRAGLPDYMVPAVFVALDEFPLNASGKLDRKALPKPDTASLAAEYRAPETDVERALVAVFEDILGAERVGVDDDFFALGGNSLSATRAIARANADLKVKVDVRGFFDAPTVAALAELVGRSRSSEDVVREALTARTRPDRVPLSLAQQRMWFLDKLDPESGANNIPVAIRLSGSLDVEALRDAIGDVVARHESLRTVYPEIDGAGIQDVRPSIDDLLGSVIPVSENEIDLRVLELATQGFDVTTDVPVRVALLESAPDEHVLVVVIHHISADGFSFGPLTRDLIGAYAARLSGDGPQWAPLPVQYADYALWQRSVLGETSDPSSVAATQLRYWTEQLDGLPSELTVPVDFERPVVASGVGRTLRAPVGSTVRSAVEAFASTSHVTPFMVVHTALAILLARLSATSDIAIGAPVAGRGEPELDELIGMFVNTLVLRTEIESGSTVNEVLARVREVDLSAFGHADLPFETLVQHVDPVRSRGRHPLVQIALFFQNLEQVSVELPGVTVRGLDFDATAAKFDLQITVSDDGHGGWILESTYATDLFVEGTVSEFAARLIGLLEQMCANPSIAVGDLTVMNDADTTRLLTALNDTDGDISEDLVTDAFFEAAAARPDATVLVDEDRSLTYREFAAEVDAVAAELVSLGVGPEDLVAVAVRRSVDVVIAIHAVLRAGAGFVPIDPDHPRERIEYILAQADPVCVLVRRRDGFAAPGDSQLIDLDQRGGEPADPRVLAGIRRPRPDNTAYVIFTSGSTGKPKGVAVSHRAIVNQLDWMQSEYRLTTDDVYLQKTATTFDVSLWGYLLPPRTGTTLVLASPDGHRDPDYLSAVIRARGVTVTDFVPTMLSVFVSSITPGSIDTLNRIFVIGEALPGETVRAFSRVSSARVHNLYGPTEAAVSITYADVTGAAAGAVTIGVPERNSQVYVLDSRLHPVPPGVPGELYLGGVQLARGYLGRVDLTVDRFVANPFATASASGSSRMYRTGDLVRWSASGELEYIGRTDFQVKFRGQRIELGEIEGAISLEPEVAQATVQVVATPTGDQLIGYVTTTPGSTVDEAALRKNLRSTLPEYMIPASVIFLEQFPLNSSGKLDRKALPEPSISTSEFRAPSTPIEEIVAGVFGDVLGVERVGVDDDFFALGGNSLIATKVVSRLGAALDTAVPVRILFEVSTVGALAVRIESEVGHGARVPLARRDRPERIPLSMAQQRMWFLNRLEPDSAVNNIPVAIRLSGLLDRHALHVAVADVLARHEALRTVYPEIDGVGYQEVVSTGSVIPDLSPIKVDADRVAASIEETILAGFDVTTRSPFRASLFEVSGAEHVLVFVVHHIAADGYSLGPLTRDVVRAYTARAAGLDLDWEPLPVQYADYTLWQREVLGSENDPDSVISAQKAFWQNTLAGLPEQLDLPFDHPRPAVATNRGRTHRFEISASLRTAVEALAAQQHSTPFMVVHAAVAVLLARLSGTDDIAVGAPIAGRGEAALDDMIGMFVNTLVLRTQVDAPSTFEQILGQVREGDLAAFANADIPFERLVEILDPARSTARHPLFQVALFFQNLGRNALELPNLSVSAVDFDAGIAKFDLQIAVSDSVDGDRWTVEFNYAADLFEQFGIEVLQARLLRVLGAITADPSVVIGDIDVTTESEREQLVRGWNHTDHELDEEMLLDRFAEIASGNPEKVALTYEGESITYGDFARRVDDLARVLAREGAGPDTLVALAVRRSIDLVVGMYAVLRAGAGFVPIDPDHPLERIGYILGAADPICVLTRTEDEFTPPGTVPVIDVHAVPSDIGSVRLRPRVTDQSVAYVIFTSGSTGKPKGVAVSHRAIVNQMEWMQSEYLLDHSDVYLQKTATTFDVSLWGFFLPLRVGARMVLATPDGHRDPGYLAEVISRDAVTVTDFVPTMLSVFSSAVARSSLRSLKQIFVIGEALPGETVRDFARVSDARVHNLYGPTEAAVSITYADVTDTAAGSAVTIGRPEWNSAVYVLDSRLNPVPAGVPGELYLSGVQLARGYHGRVDLTADRFVANPFVSDATSAASRMYRTGDLVTVRSDGNLDYIGRTDFQVKFRGQRIELGEIEAALAAHPTVGAAAVSVVPTDAGEQLVAYVVPSSEAAVVDLAELKSAAGRTLPRYMIPSAVVVLDEFPLNTSGKLDRKALPAPEFEAAEFRAPRTPIEEIVAGVYAEVLGLERVGLDDDFFALGGNSLVATQLVSRLGAALDSRVAVRALFEAPTVEALAGRVEWNTGDRLALTAMPRPARIPLSLAQQRMWFLNRLDPESAVNNIPAAVRLSGALDVSALRSAIDDLVARHETLRTVYPESAGTGIQVILPASSGRTDFGVHQVAESDVPSAVVSIVTEGFDVTRVAPLRIRLLEITETEHVLVVVAYHIAADGFSMIPLVRDVITAYVARARGDAPEWSPLTVQYADYTLWQRQVLGSSDDPTSLVAVQEEYWKNTLAGLGDELELPVDRARPTVASGRGASHTFVLDVGVSAELDRLATRRGSTVFMVVHAALAVLLARISGSSDIALGTPVAGRGEAVLDDVIGMFVNTLVLRTQVDAASSFDQVLAGVREADLSAFAHADVPFERVVEVLDPPRVQGRHPLVQVLLTFANFAQTSFELPGLTASSVDFDSAVAKMDLQFTVTEPHELDDGTRSRTVEMVYATDLFDSATIEALGRRFHDILAAVTTNSSVAVGDIGIVDAVTRDRVLSQWSSSGPDVSGGADTLVDRFDASVAANPDGVAVRFGDESVSYRELDVSVNRLARRLIAAGARADALVAVALPRSVELVVALLAVVKSGAGYLPVDPSYPGDRIEFMVADASPVAVVTTSEVLAGESMSAVRGGGISVVDVSDAAGEWDSGPVTDADRVARLSAESLAYVIYTSGSTGRPKGVLIPHDTVLRLMDNTDSSFGFGADDVWTMFHSYAFDFSVWELWGPLLYGGTLVMVDYFTSRSPEAFRELLVTEGVTVLNQTPSAFYQLAEVDRVQAADAGELSLRYVVFGGEALEPRRLEGWFDRHGDGSASESGVGSGPLLVNMYGITETTVHVSFRALSVGSVGSASVIGAPISGLGVYVLDARLQPVPVGVAGELYVSGGQLARGYLGRADLTSVRFVANPFGVGRLYRTGDVARWTEDVDGRGELVYLGRADDQVKVRGFRIELGEIEAAVSGQVGVTAAAVIVREDSPGAQRLVAYVVGDVDVEGVRAGVAELVPEYMVPSAFVSVEAIPLTVNGKLDRRALPVPSVVSSVFRAPSTPVEEIVAGVFADVLGVARVGVDDDFFALGGNSLIATQVVSRLGSALDASVPVRLLFDTPTVDGLARALNALVGTGGRPPLVAGERPDRIPLSLAQQRMWVLNQVDPDSGAYNIPLAVRLTGALDVGALGDAVADVVARHESLRTIYPSDGDGPQQRILEESEVSFDLGPTVVDDEAGAWRAVADLVLGGFDVAAAVPVRVRLIQVSDEDYVLALVVHHISADGASIAPLARDVMVAYSARTAEEQPLWVPLPVQYADFALWQRDVLGTVEQSDSVAAEQLSYWTEQLSGSPDTLDLPTDRPRPPTQSMQGRSVTFELDAAAHAGLADFSRDRGTSLFMVVHAGLAVLLGRLSGSSDVVIGTPVAGRGAAELDELVGMFVNTLALRTHVDFGGTFSGLVDDVRSVDLGAFGNADLPFESIVDAVVPSRSQARHPIFQVALSFQNLERVKLDLPGLTVEGLDAGELGAKFDLQFTIEARTDENGTPAGLFGSVLYATDLFDEATARSFGDRLTRILSAVAEDPYTIVGDIDIMSEQERRQTESQASAPVDAGSSAVAIDRALPQVIGSVVELDPEAPAIAYDGEELSYLEVEGRASRLARVLIDNGIGPGERVAIALPISVDWAVTVLATIAAGAAVVVGDRHDDLARLASTAEATTILGEAATAVPAGTRSIAVDDPATVDAVRQASPRPVAYSARTRLLGVDDPAVVVVRTDGHVAVLAQGEVVASLTGLVGRLGMTFESRVLSAAETGEAWQLTALLASVTVGAAWVVPPPDEGALADTVADEWVTHAIVGRSAALLLDSDSDSGEDLDLEAVVVTEVDTDETAGGGHESISVFTGETPFGQQ